ncbi:MAG: hypothetical protein A3F91_09925 [Flavobacteria bacterium RIFCSPLOWO2_12_FULL_35_11]|nr:MAG: hypothetical protein A3F91_09925 [Flavobacteria bacterium RIFCSPLOWO2_12_FULL_35_11]
MKKIYCILALVCIVNGDEIKMKDIGAMISEEKKVILIDKKDLSKFISDKKREATQGGVESIEMPQMRGEILIRSLKDYIGSINYLGGKTHEIKYEVGLASLLEITKYIFLHNLDIARYEEIKPLLLEEGKKYPKINQKEFRSALNNMSYALACEIYEDVSFFVN